MSVLACCRFHILYTLDAASQCVFVQPTGPPRLMQLTPQFVVLFPPNQVVLEISATGYTAITWLVNGTDMHDFERIVLENFSMRFILVDTMESDTGVYEADVHTVFGNVNMATFYVDTFSKHNELSAPHCLNDVILIQVRLQ